MDKNLLTVTVKACVDDVKGLIEQLKSLQTYKLFVGDDMTLVDINDVIEIFANHIKAERTTSLHEVPSAQPEIIYCKDCKWKQGAECVRFADVRPFPSDFCSRAERREDERTD